MSPKYKEAGSIEAIKDLWEDVAPDKKADFLLQAIHILKKDICGKIDSVQDTVNTMKGECECRTKQCTEKFITRKQAKWIIGTLIACFIFWSLGVGYLTVSDILKISGSKIVP